MKRDQFFPATGIPYDGHRTNRGLDKLKFFLTIVPPQ